VRRLALAITVLAWASLVWAPAQAPARQRTGIRASFSPERLGSATTVSLSFKITAGKTAPAALTAMSIAYPRNLGFVTSGLGLAACSTRTLERLGPEACPANSKMGYGSAVVEIPIGPSIVKENVVLTVFAGPSPDGYLHLLVCASGKEPVLATAILSGVLLPGRLSVVVPPIPSLPEAPYVSLVQMHLTIGGKLTYYKQRDGATVAYRPAGVGLPQRCPRGGFAFAAAFVFRDGSRSNARTAVPCPR
jgi:hypothetical protein